MIIRLQSIRLPVELQSPVRPAPSAVSCRCIRIQRQQTLVPMQWSCLTARPGEVLACTKHACGLPHMVPHARPLLRMLQSPAGATLFRRQLAREEARQHAVGRCRRGAQTTAAMFGGLGKLFKGDEGERTRARYQAQVDAINALEPEMQRLSDDDLRARTVSLRQRAQGGSSLSELLVEAFAVCATLRTRVESVWRQICFDAPACAWPERMSSLLARHFVGIPVLLG